MRTETNLELRYLINRFANKDIQLYTFEELKRYLAEKFGNPVETALSDGINMVAYMSPMGDFAILETSDGKTFLGSFFQKGLRGTPTPSCVKNAGTLMAPGAASETYYLPIFYLAIRLMGFPRLTRIARGRASTNYWILYAAVSANLCNPPCTPFSTALPDPAPVIMETVNRALGVPVSLTVTVVTWQHEALSCS